MSGEKSLPLAPFPPAISSLAQQQDRDLPLRMAEIQNSIEPAAMGYAGYQPLSNVQGVAQGLDATSTSYAKCNIGKRFDKKALLAYEWGRKRVALDVGGMNFSGSGDKSVRLEYKIRLQPEKTREQKCRYESQWQGLVGSGYNEFVLREKDTVWDEIHHMKNDFAEYVGRVFE